MPQLGICKTIAPLSVSPNDVISSVHYSLFEFIQRIVALIQLDLKATIKIVCLLVIHSFIHYVDLYSASSRLLLRSAPDFRKAKKRSFRARIECVRVNPGEQLQCKWKPIPDRVANHRECTSLAS